MQSFDVVVVSPGHGFGLFAPPTFGPSIFTKFVLNGLPVDLVLHARVPEVAHRRCRRTAVPLQERADLALEEAAEVARADSDVVGDEDRRVVARDEGVHAVRVRDLVLGAGHKAAADAVARAAEHGLRVAAAVGALDRVEREDVVAAVGGQRGLAREVEELVREVVREADLRVRIGDAAARCSSARSSTGTPRLRRR